jgi:hypothetical protein
MCDMLERWTAEPVWSPRRAILTAIACCCLAWGSVFAIFYIVNL